MVLHLRSPGPGRVRDLPVVLFGPVDGFWQSVGARLQPATWTKLACISTIFYFYSIFVLTLDVMRASVFPFIVTTGLSVEVCWLWATYNSAACYMFGGFNHRGCQVFGTLGFLQFLLSMGCGHRGVLAAGWGGDSSE